MKTKLSEEEIRKVLDEYAKVGVSLNDLSKKYNVSVPTLKSYCNKHGIPVKTTADLRFEKKKLIDNFIIRHLDAFVKNNITAKQMAQEFGCAELTMRKHLRRFLNAKTLSEGKVYYRIMHGMQ